MIFRSIQRAVESFVLVATAGVVPAWAVQPGMKLGISFSDQFGSPGGPYNPTDTYVSREIVPSIFVGVPFGGWRWVPTLSFLEKDGYVSVWAADTTQWWGSRRNSSRALQYVSCQSDVQFTFPLGNADFYFLASPRLDLLLSNGSYQGVSPNGSGLTGWAPPSYAPATFGVSFGIGQDISIGDDVLFFEFRYDRDWTAYWSTGEESFPGGRVAESSWYNRLFLVQFGVRVNAARRRDPGASTDLWPPVGE